MSSKTSVAAAMPLAPSPSPFSTTIEGVVIGRLVGLSEDGTPRVAFSVPGTGSAKTCRATHLVTLRSNDVGREVALLFEGGDSERPVVMGLLAVSKNGPFTEKTEPIVTTIDADTLFLRGNKEIVLKCGDASIVLTRAGKIIVKGAYVLSRATGVNSVQGGSVRIN